MREEKPLPEFKRVDHKTVCERYGEAASLVVDINESVRVARKAALPWPILTLALFEFRLLEFLGFESAFEMLMKVSSNPFLFTLLIILRCVITAPFIDGFIDFLCVREIKPKCDVARAQELVLGQQYLKKDLPKQLSESIKVYQRVYQQLQLPKRNAILISSTFLFALVLFSLRNPLRVGSSFFLSAIFPALKELYRYFSRRVLNLSNQQYFDVLTALFKQDTLCLEQVVYGANPRRVGIYSLLYSREVIVEELLLKYMFGSPAFTVIAVSEKGIIFKIASLSSLAALRSIECDISKKKSLIEILPEIETNLSPVLESHVLGKPQKPTLVEKKKRSNREGLTNAGAVHVDWSAISVKPKQSKPTEKKRPEATPSEKHPEWLNTFYSGADEILKMNSVNGEPKVLIFIIGSAMEDIRNNREFKRSPDIDLLIIVLDSHQFVFPGSFKILNLSPNEYNNHSCEYQGLKIDVTVKIFPLSDPYQILMDFLQKNDFSHTRTFIPYKNGIEIKMSAHSFACRENRVLSTFPNKAMEIFQKDPYCIFRALSAIFSGFYRVDVDMFDTLRNLRFCFESTLRLPPKRIFTGIHKLFTKAQPALVVAELKKFTWLDQYFSDASKIYDLTLARVDYLYRQLKNTALEKELAVIYSLLLWPSFSTEKFYKPKETHFSRVNQFFKSKNIEDGILFHRRSNEAEVVMPSPENIFLQDSILQTKISLMLCWLSIDLKNFDGEAALGLFAPALIERYQLCRPMLREAFRVQLPPVDYRALLKESLFENPHPCGFAEDVSINPVGLTRNYFFN